MKVKWFLIFAFIFLTSFIKASSMTTSSLYVNPEGLIVYYPFDQCTGTSATDRGDWGNTGTLTGGANTTWATGKYGCGIKFSGTTASNSYINCGNGAILTGMTSLTISVWVKANTLAIADALVVGKSGSYYISLKSTQTDVGLWKNPPATYTSVLIMPTNTWTYLSFVWNGSNIYVYADGILSDTGAFSGTGISSGNNLGIGGYADGTTLFNGTIDEVKIWNSALSAEEIYVDYLGTYHLIERYYANASAISNLNTTLMAINNSLLSFYNNLASNITNNHGAIATNLSNLKITLDATNNSLGSFYNNLASNATNNFNAIARNLTGMNLTLMATNNSLNAFYNALASNSSQTLELLTGHDNNLTTLILMQESGNYNITQILLTNYSGILESMAENVSSLANISVGDIWNSEIERVTNCSNCTGGTVEITVNNTNTTNNYPVEIVVNQTNSTYNFTDYYGLSLDHQQIRDISKGVVKYQIEVFGQTILFGEGERILIYIAALLTSLSLGFLAIVIKRGWFK